VPASSNTTTSSSASASKQHQHQYGWQSPAAPSVAQLYYCRAYGRQHTSKTAACFGVLSCRCTDKFYLLDGTLYRHLGGDAAADKWLHPK